MRPSPRPPSPIPSCTGSRSPCSAAQGHLSPRTPEFCFSPTPTIVTPDEFALQIDVQFDKMPPVPSPKTDSGFLSEDDMNNLQVFLRNRGRWEDMYDRFESSPPLRPRDPPLSQDSACDPLSWEATHSSPVDPTELLDLSRYSLLIHEVSLLVGLAADDDHLSSGDGCPLTLDGPTQTPDILPLNLTPTKSLASRKHRNASGRCPVNTSVQLHSSSIPISPTANVSLHNEKNPTPIARHKSADAVHRSPSPRRRQGQVFHFEPPLSNAHRRIAVDLDDTFSHPRDPPPRPPPTPSANRCSSLDRLECSLRKLEAHAPGSHRKSQSEGRSLDQVAQRKDKRPSLPPLPPPRRLRKQRSTHETMRPSPPRPAVECHFSGASSPASRSIPLHQYVAPRACPEVPLDDGHHEEAHTPGSFMDMDIPLTEGASQKRQASFRQVASKEKTKNLLSIAKRVSRGVIAWGKNLTGPTKLSASGQETATIQNLRV